MEHRVFSFGCRLNIAEGEQIAALLASPSSVRRETLVVNSCAVTHEAERQVRQKIRRLHRERPQARIVVAGCAAHMNAESYRKMTGVTKVLGNDSKLLQSSYTDADTRIPAMLPRAERERQTPLLAPDTPKEQQSEPQALVRTRFVLPVQQGCNHRCTFCMIPLARGSARSLAIEPVCESVGGAVARGVKEVVLSGIDLASWGEDLPQRPPLGILVEAVLTTNPRLERLRLSSIDGAALDPLLLRLFGEEERLQPYLHLSLQAGDNMILKRMRRRHSREQAITLCRNLRERRPDIALGADLIAGFPTETETMFQNTLALIDDAGLNLLHIFPFSPRQGTAAARMPQVERSIVRARANKLRLRAEEAHKTFLRGLYATNDRFLVEGVENKDGGEEEVIGRSRHNIRTRLLHPHIAKQDVIRGSVIRARILSATEQLCARSLTARMV